MDILDQQTLELLPIVKGSSRELIFTTLESKTTGVVFAQLEGSEIIFTLRRAEDTAIIFTKKTLNLGGSDEQVKVNTSSSFSVFLIPTDTVNFVKFPYYFDIVITTSDDKIYKVKGTLPII